MHPRDWDTWLLLDIQDEMDRKTEQGFEQARAEYRQRIGG